MSQENVELVRAGFDLVLGGDLAEFEGYLNAGMRSSSSRPRFQTLRRTGALRLSPRLGPTGRIVDSDSLIDLMDAGDESS